MTEITPSAAHHRIDELDYLKGIMIVLMISFHLVYIGDSYPYAKQVVYTFHMPVFLVISGYLMNMRKEPRRFLEMMLWFAVPYVVMESGYTVMASLLPIREHINHLTPAVFAEKLFLHPLGPYWYLHTLMLCGLTCYAVFHRDWRMGLLSRYILTGLLFAAYAHLGIVSLSLSLYFLAGVIVQQSSLTFLQVFRSSPWAVLPVILLATCPENLNHGTAGGALIVYLVMSTCLAVYPYLGKKIGDVLLFLGRNTLPLFLFSPIFTILCKPLVPLLSFDPTGLLFLAVSLVICITGSMAICWVMTRRKWTNIFKLRVIS